MKMRSDSILKTLTPKQLDDLFDLLAAGASYREARLHCAAAPPNGFGIEVHHTTIVRFYKSERRRRHAEELAETKYDNLDSDNPEQLLNSVRLELAHACYDLAHQPDASNVNILARITHRLDRIRIEQDHLILARDCLAEKIRQFNFNAAREAAKHAAEIHKVIEAKGPDAEGKTWMVSDVLFGPPPQKQLPEQSNS